MGYIVEQCNATHDDFLQTLPLIGRMVDIRLACRGSQISLNCYSMCAGRLNQLHRRLKKSVSLFKEYDDVISKQMKDGIIERVSPHQETSRDSHFWPYHCVLHEDKSTTKLRIVFDGSAKSALNDLSLNDCLEKGPNGTPHIFDFLLRF